MLSKGAEEIGARPSGSGPQPAPGFEVRSPADGSVVASLPDQGAGEVRAAAGRLRGNQPAWEALGPTGRGRWLGRLRDWLFDNDERVAELLQRETGKPWQEATLEVPVAIDLLEYYRKRAEKFLADSHPRPYNLLIASRSSRSPTGRTQSSGSFAPGTTLSCSPWPMRCPRRWPARRSPSSRLSSPG
jgi:acyl-CoA reductase-like NAD-dependent aldehyde dehydrogenase